MGFDFVEYFVDHFPELLSSFATPNKMEQYTERIYYQYQLLYNTDIPSEIWVKAKVREDDSVY